MKTSALIATIAIAGSFITVTATNLILKKEYTRGNLKDPYVKAALPSFRFVKDLTDSLTTRLGNFEIRVGKTETTGVAHYYSETTQFLFTVLHDTLYIRSDPRSENEFANWAPLILRTNDLQSVDLMNGEYSISSTNGGDLTVNAKRRVEVRIQVQKLNSLTVTASNNASVSVAAKDTLKKINIQLKDGSSFAAKDLVIGERNLQLSNKANLQLSGRSIENFGLKSVQ